MAHKKGTAGDDNIGGTAKKDSIEGLGGSDTLSGIDVSGPQPTEADFIFA